VLARYAGTVGGLFWAIAHPVAIVTVFYFVFTKGFDAKAPDGLPFISWFSVGLMAWFYINDSLMSICGSVIRNTSYVKKTVFPLEILPIVQLLSTFLLHVAFLIVVFGLLAFNGTEVRLARIGVIYYMFCASTLIIGVGWFISAVEVFYRDTSQALTVVLNILFWCTPIVWSANLIPPEYSWVLDWNPIKYVIDGYRNTLLYQHVNLPELAETVRFWAFVAPSVCVGYLLFRRLKGEFADLL